MWYSMIRGVLPRRTSPQRLRPHRKHLDSFLFIQEVAQESLEERPHSRCLKCRCVQVTTSEQELPECFLGNSGNGSKNKTNKPSQTKTKRQTPSTIYPSIQLLLMQPDSGQFIPQEFLDINSHNPLSLAILGGVQES